MISGSVAKTSSDTTTGSLSYINNLVTGATSSGSYHISVSNRFMNDTMATLLRSYGYNVTTNNDYMGTNNDYVITWGTINVPTPVPTSTATPTPTSTRVPKPTPTPTASSTPTPTPTATTSPTPTATAATTPTPTPTSLYQSYNYSISATDLAAATGNTGGNAVYNNKVVVVLTNGYNCGNTTVRNFTYSFDSAGSSYVSWLLSLKTNVPVLGYYKDNVLVTTGLISTQTANPSVPC
jgi:hypothetical protein